MTRSCTWALPLHWIFLRSLCPVLSMFLFGVSASRSATLSYVFWLDMGVGWGWGWWRSLHNNTSLMLRTTGVGWGGVGLGMMTFLAQHHIYARCWVGVGGMLTFLTLAHMLDGTRCWVGVGGMLTFLTLAHMLDATQDAGLGWGGC